MLYSDMTEWLYCTELNYVQISVGENNFVTSDRIFQLKCPFAQFASFRGILLSHGFHAGSDCEEHTCNVGDLVSVPGLGRSLDKGMDIHSSILARKISWTVQSMVLQRVGHGWATFTSLPSHATLPLLITNFISIWFIVFAMKIDRHKTSHTKCGMFSKFPIFCSYFQNIAFGISIFIILEVYFQSKFSELELLCELQKHKAFRCTEVISLETGCFLSPSRNPCECRFPTASLRIYTAFMLTIQCIRKLSCCMFFMEIF